MLHDYLPAVSFLISGNANLEFLFVNNCRKREGLTSIVECKAKVDHSRLG